jgi:PAS domain-containing protein
MNSTKEFAWRRFFENVAEPLFLLNRQQYLIHFNERFRELTGLPAAKLQRLSCGSRSFPPGTRPGDASLRFC